VQIHGMDRDRFFGLDGQHIAEETQCLDDKPSSAGGCGTCLRTIKRQVQVLSAQL
jgi:hypothetical protein